MARAEGLTSVLIVRDVGEEGEHAKKGKVVFWIATISCCLLLCCMAVSLWLNCIHKP